MKKPSIEEVFSAGGVLSRSFPGFEYRPQQEVLAERVWSCLDAGDGGILLRGERGGGVQMDDAVHVAVGEADDGAAESIGQKQYELTADYICKP